MKDKKDKHWPFNLPKQKLVLTSRHVEEGAPVYYVSHDEGDGVWQFHPHEKFGDEEADNKLVSLKSLYLRDKTLGELGDLAEGWHAWRDAPDEPWQREKIPS
jgi:hypothetical protein